MRIIIKAKNLKISQDFREWVKNKFSPLRKLHPNFRKRDKLPGGGEDERIDMRVEVEKIKRPAARLHSAGRDEGQRGEYNFGRDKFNKRQLRHGDDKGTIFRAEAQLQLPGKVLLRAEAVGENLRTAVEKAKDRLARRIKKHRGKEETWV